MASLLLSTKKGFGQYLDWSVLDKLFSSERVKGLRPLFFVSRILGTAPFTLNRSKVSTLGLSTTRAGLSSFWLWYSRILLITFLFAQGYVNYVISKDSVLPSKNKDTRMSNILNIIYYTMFYVKSVGTYLACIFVHHRTILSLANSWIGESLVNNRRFRICQILVLVLTIVVFGLLEIFYCSGQKTYPTWFIVTEFITYYGNDGITCILEIQFGIWAFLLRCQFRLINEQLLDLTQPRLQTNNNFRRHHPAKPPILYDLEQGGYLPLTSRLRSIRKDHCTLFDMVDKMNTCFGPHLLVEVSYAFVQSTVSWFGLLNHAVKGDLSTQSIDIFCWSTAYLSKLFIMVVLAHCTLKEAARTAPLVHNVLNQLPLHPNEREEIVLFSQQLLSLGQPRFVVCGCFPFDVPLIYTMVGSISTYLIILLQFQQAPASSA